MSDPKIKTARLLVSLLDVLHEVSEDFNEVAAGRSVILAQCDLDWLKADSETWRQRAQRAERLLLHHGIKAGADGVGERDMVRLEAGLYPKVTH